MRSLKRHYRASFKADEMQEAFDLLIPTWSNETGAMIYLSSKQVMSALDMLILTATVDNRREIEIIRRKEGFIYSLLTNRLHAMSTLVRISEELIPWIDAAVEQAKDELGTPKFKSQREVVDTAIKDLVRKLGVKPKEEAG